MRRLRSPFPGMDPYLEVNPRWEAFHDWFIRKLAEFSIPKAEDVGCWIDVERTVYQREPSGEMVLLGEPDVLAGPDLSVSSWKNTNGGTAVALAEPKAVHEVVLDPDVMQRYKQDYLVVREVDEFQRIIAVVELLSFANKIGNYVPKYREKRSRFMGSGVHFMEIDFLRAGDNPARKLFPELAKTPYFIFVARKTGMGRNEEGYPLRLQDPLPIIGLPLGPKRPDLPLDLPAAFESAYELSMSPRRIRYAEQPVPGPPLSDEDAKWVTEVIRKATDAGTADLKSEI